MKNLSFLLAFQILCLIGKDNPHQGSYNDGAQMNGIQPEEIGRLQEEIEELKSNQELLQSQLAEKDSLIENLVSKCLKILNNRSGVILIILLVYFSGSLKPIYHIKV